MNPLEYDPTYSKNPKKYRGLYQEIQKRKRPPLKRVCTTARIWRIHPHEMEKWKSKIRAED
jgi:hypothetical protein